MVRSVPEITMGSKSSSKVSPKVYEESVRKQTTMRIYTHGSTSKGNSGSSLQALQIDGAGSGRI